MSQRLTVIVENKRKCTLSVGMNVTTTTRHAWLQQASSRGTIPSALYSELLLHRNTTRTHTRKRNIVAGWLQQVLTRQRRHRPRSLRRASSEFPRAPPSFARMLLQPPTATCIPDACISGCLKLTRRRKTSNLEVCTSDKVSRF
jgi:hypothetical protein